MDYALLKSFAVALLLGFAIGMQRAMSKKEGDAFATVGGRTFALLAMAGFLAGWLQEYLPGIALVTAAGVFGLVVLSYWAKVWRRNKEGMTTQVSALVTFLLGVMLWYRLDEYAIFIGVLVILLLEIKPRLRRLESRISPTDVNAVTLLLVMSFVILPVLPDEMVGPYHLFNPYKTWLMAVIIAAISFVGYVAVKLLGTRHGIFLTGAAGGLVSSTGVTVSLSKMYRSDSGPFFSYAGGIAVACTIMYFRVWLEAFVVDPALSVRLAVPYMLATVTGLLFVWHLYRHAGRSHIAFDNPALARNPLQLSEAIKFGLLFGVVYGAIAFVQGRYGDIGVYVVSFFSGITDVDAITLSLSQMAGEGKVAPFAAIVGIVVASVTNSLVKLGLVFWLAGPKLGWKLTQFFALTLGAMGVGVALEALRLGAS
ncbi:MgtC/SapB family protein [Hydrogenimonas sp.]